MLTLRVLSVLTLEQIAGGILETAGFVLTLRGLSVRTLEQIAGGILETAGFVLTLCAYFGTDSWGNLRDSRVCAHTRVYLCVLWNR